MTSCVHVSSVSASAPDHRSPLPSFRAAFGSSLSPIHTTFSSPTMHFPTPSSSSATSSSSSPPPSLPRLQERLDDLQQLPPAPAPRPVVRRADVSPNNQLAELGAGRTAAHSVEALLAPATRRPLHDEEAEEDEEEEEEEKEEEEEEQQLRAEYYRPQVHSRPGSVAVVVEGALAPERSPSSWSETSSCVSNQSPREDTTTAPGASSSTSSTSGGGDTASAKRKRPRFLGDIDRRLILQRLANGEKQADLAREFGVTRAAICHINKNRDEILTRFDILARSPQGRQMIENYVRAPHVASCVRELRTPSAAVLLTRLRDASLALAAFKATADRLMSMLLEESLVGFGTRAVGVEDLAGASYDGKEYARAAFALSLGEAGRPLLNAFAMMEPAAFRGFVHVDEAAASPSSGAKTSTRPRVVLRGRIDLPADAADGNVLLLQVGLDASGRTDAAVEALLARGVAAARICVVCVTAAADAVAAFASRFRGELLLQEEEQEQEEETEHG